MAKILWPDTENAPAGRREMSTFQKTLYNNVAQQTNWLVNDRKHSQQQQRQRFRYVTSFWTSLSEAQKQAWNEAAPEGQNGFHFFMSENSTKSDYYKPVKTMPTPPSQDGIIIAYCEVAVNFASEIKDTSAGCTIVFFPELGASGTFIDEFIGIQLSTDPVITPNKSLAVAATRSGFFRIRFAGFAMRILPHQTPEEIAEANSFCLFYDATGSTITNNPTWSLIAPGAVGKYWP